MSVDDDGQDCPAAAFATIQAAVDAAGAGDTVAVCPGTYTEGSGAPGSSALTITKDLTLKGAGADLVRIVARRSTAAGGQIAAETFDLADGRGNLVAVHGGSGAPVTVTLSGVTVDGGGVYSEAGIVFIDAQGAITRSRVTNVVTSEAADAYATTPGAWRGPQPGYGIAQVTAAGSAPAGAAPRTLTITNTRIDRYNRAGVLFQGSPFVGNRGAITASEVVGRVLCQNFTVNGNCSAPGLVTTGPLFGQDGVRITGGARATIEGSSITQNLVNGAGSPVRQRWNDAGTEMTNPGTAGNENLDEGAGVRLVGADAANSLITRTNIVDNAYGVYNAEADGTTPSATAVSAPNNWWGLRFSGAGAGNPVPANPGPAISPAFNPPVPENPVNGAPVVTEAGTTSSAVQFLPYRNGPQSDPNTGQLPNIQAPMPVSDAAPTVSLQGPATANRGDTVTLTATATDDFGVKRVTFSDGATVIGADDRPPYQVTWTVPGDAPCAARPLTATVEDSLGQTRSATTTLTVVGPNQCRPVVQPPGPKPAPPGLAIAGQVRSVRPGGTTITARATSTAGIARVDFLLGTRRVCTDRTAPYRCRVTPRGGDVGLQSLRVVATDVAGQRTVVERPVLVPRFAARGVSVEVKQTPLARGGVRRTITAHVRPPAPVTRRQGCAAGTITFVVQRNARAFMNVQRRLGPDCGAALSFVAPRGARRVYTVSARFGGTTVLLPATTSRRFS
jgi:hypothetical protein